VEYLGKESCENTSSGGALITKVILEDDNGRFFSVDPNINGLKFAKGEISYTKYNKLQKKNDFNMFVCFFGIVGFFGVSMFIISKLI
jgi:uncharacterized membrane protein YebE (DUF533 family)